MQRVVVSAVTWSLPSEKIFDKSTAPASISSSQICNNEPKINHRIGLDPHANMVVMGINSFIYESSERTCDIK